MLETQLPLVFALIWSLFLSNWLTSILGLAVASPLARLTEQLREAAHLAGDSDRATALGKSALEVAIAITEQIRAAEK